jgi:hypothetical protein
MKKLFPLLWVAGSLTGTSPQLSAQDVDPFAPESPKQGNPSKDLANRAKLHLVYEVFSLPMTKAAELQRARIPDSEIYRTLVAGLKDESVKQEVFLVARGLSGVAIEAREIKEYSYPTEFDPPELPNMVAGQHEKGDGQGKSIRIFPATPANPTNYQTRITGNSFGAEAVVRGDLIDFRVSANRLSLIHKDTYGQGLAKADLPRFAHPSLQTGITTRSGKPFYLGTVSDPSELQPEKGEQTVSFAFLTATRLK